MAKVGLETISTNSSNTNNLRETAFPSGANSGAVEAHPPSALLSAVLELLKQLPDADRLRLADALRDG
jgi:hypothetical protein